MDDILKRELNGEKIPVTDPQFYKILDIIEQTMVLTAKLNQLDFKNPQAREIINEILGYELDNTTTLIPPFYTDFGKNIKIGKNCFIQQECTFFDRGGIIIGDHVLIAPKVNLITLNHDIHPDRRRDTFAKPIVIEDNAWIGINCTILPGVTIGKNAVVSAGSVVTKDVIQDTIVGGNPAKFIKMIEY